MSYWSTLFNPGGEQRGQAAGWLNQGGLQGGTYTGAGGVMGGFSFDSQGNMSTQSSLGDFAPLLGRLLGVSQQGYSESQKDLPPDILAMFGQAQQMMGGQSQAYGLDRMGDYGQLGDVMGQGLGIATADPMVFGDALAGKLKERATLANQNLVNTTFDRLFQSGGLSNQTTREQTSESLSRQLNEQNLGFDIAGLQYGQGLQQDAFSRAMGALQGRQQISGDIYGQQMGREQMNQQQAGMMAGLGSQLQGLRMERQGQQFGFGQQALGAAQGLQQLPLQLQQFILQAQQARSNAAIGVGSGFVGSAGTVTPMLDSVMGAVEGLVGAMAASDPRLKKNVKYLYTLHGYNWYEYDWTNEAKTLGYGEQPTFGVMADEVLDVKPEAVREINGYLHVNYGIL